MKTVDAVRYFRSCGFYDGSSDAEILERFRDGWGDPLPDGVDALVLALDHERVVIPENLVEENESTSERVVRALCHIAGIAPIRVEPSEAPDVLDMARRINRLAARSRRLHVLGAEDAPFLVVAAPRRTIRRIERDLGWDFGALERERRRAARGRVFRGMRQRARAWWDAFWWPFRVKM